MNTLVYRLVVAAALGAAASTFAVAQEAETDQSTTETPQNGAADTAEPEADTETQAAPTDESEGADSAPAETEEAATGDPAEPEVLEIVRETHGDWQVRCAPEGSDCFLYQLALDGEENPVAEFSLFVPPVGSEASAVVTIVTPLGTFLPAGIGLQVDSGEIERYGFSWCSQVGCFARFGVGDETVASMKRGSVAKAQLVSVAAQDQPIMLEVSLSGFTAAFDSLEPTAN